MSQNVEARMRVIEEMQAFAHQQGCEEFLAAVSEALGYCAEETENMENKSVSARYEIRQMQVNGLLDDSISQSNLRSHRAEKQAEEIRSSQGRIVGGLETVQVGQIWRENDSRHSSRTVRVIAVSEESATIFNSETDKTTVAALRRFNGKSRGYSLVGGV